MNVNVKVVVTAVVVGVLVGLGIGFPISQAVKPTKVVTKTQVVAAKIQNGESVTDLAKQFGAPYGQFRPNLSINVGGCYVYRGPNAANGSPEWIVLTCLPHA